MDKPQRSVIHLEAIDVRSDDVREELDVIARQLKTKGAVTLRDLEAAKYQKKSSQQ
jgi:hypothetical protein